MEIHPLYVRSALPGEDQSALRLLRHSHRSAEENLQQVAYQLALLEAGRLDPTGILACLDSHSRDVVGCLLAQGDSSKSALAWPPGVGDAKRQAEIEAALFAGLRDHARHLGWTSVLSFLDADDETNSATMQKGGFEAITVVQELKREPETPLPAAEQLFEWIGYRDCERELFDAAFLRTFEETLDCPELNDLRAPDSIVNGYAESAPDLRRWWLIRYRDIDIGAVILGDAADDGWEIAYFGLIPEARGAGLGKQLLHEILLKSSQMGVTTLHVRCDERNLPALAIYGQNGFRLQRSYRVLLMRQF